MRYGTYIFDFGQVIGEFEKYDIVGHFIPAGEDCELLKSVFFARDHWDKLDRGAITDDEVKEMLKAKLPERLHAVSDALYDGWVAASPVVDGMDSLIRDLKNAGAKLYLLSNFSVQFAEHYNDSPVFGELLNLFDGLVISGTIKMVKPDHAIFEYLFKKYDLTPGECLFIDDNKANIEAGNREGLNTYLFDGDAEKLRGYIFGE